MRKRVVLIAALAILLFSCVQDEDEYATDIVLPDKPLAESSYDVDTLPFPGNLEDRFSYAYGNLLAESLFDGEQTVDPLYFARGFLDYYGSASYYSDQELDAIFLEYQNYMLEEAQAAYERERGENLAKAEQFLEMNGKRNRVVTTPSGLEYEVLRAVSGYAPSPTDDDIVVIDYTITLLDGQIVESSYDGQLGSQIRVSDLIKGASEGLEIMKKGERYRFWIHPNLAYGDDGVSMIGPNELLIFEVELLDIL